VFIVYAIPVGLLVGLALGGRVERLAGLRFRWAPLAFAGLAVQVGLFSDAVGAAVGSAGPAIYIASSVAVLAAVVRNLRLPGLALVALGALSNLAAILANGGFMPASPGALVLAGLDPASGYSNSVVLAAPAVAALTDVYALPSAIPLANVFSLGDVAIGLGIVIAIAAAMGRRRAPLLPDLPLPGRTSPD
jgi:hypothetical protein